MNDLKTSFFLTACVGVLVIAFAAGCSENPGNSKGHSVDDDDTTELPESNIEQVKTIFYMLPSPIETASLLHKAGAEYDGTILNPIENVNKYELTGKKALNLGVYGADLSYASVFDQSQEVLFYISACKKLSDGLGLEKAFDPQTISRMEENINDKDSLLHLISDSYLLADTYLQENDRSNFSALIISGGWIEGLYIATLVYKNNPNEAILKRISEQKFSLSHLIEIVQPYKDDYADIEKVYYDLKELENVFNKISMTKNKATSSTNKNTGITTIGGAGSLNISPETLIELSEKVKIIRNRYTQ